MINPFTIRNPGFLIPAVTFSPTTISGLTLWLNAGSIVASDGDPVSTWADDSGTSRTATQSSSGSKPTYKTNIINSNPVVRFDGNDFLNFTNLDIANLSAFIVQKTSGDAILLAGAASYTTQVMRVEIQGGANRMTFYDGTYYPASSDLSVARTSFSLLCLTKSVGALSWYENGIAKGTTGVLSGNVTAIATGGTGGGGSVDFISLTGDVAEIIVYDSALTSTNRQLVETYLNTKYAIY